MLDVDTKEIKKFADNLKSVSSSAYPKAVRSTLDSLAYKTRAEYLKNVKDELTIRGGNNNIVLKSVHYEKCGKSLKIENMQSAAGQQAKTYGKTTEQLKKQEFGETIRAAGKHLYKATKFTRGGNYKRLVPKTNLMARLDAKHIEDIAANPIKDDVKKQFRQAQAVAHHQNKTINFLPDKQIPGKKFGVFQLKPDKKQPKLLYSFKDKTQNLKPRPMLKPATDKIAPQGGKIFVDEAEKRIVKEMQKGLKT